jgi:predicted nuclease of predicted toxin-antitoxin system
MPKFLLDENVHKILRAFLKAKRWDVKIAPRSVGDNSIAAASKKERRIVITNDEDFSRRYGSQKIFAVIWLKVAQDDSAALTHAVARVIKELPNFEGKLIELYFDHWDVSRLNRE